MIWKGQRCSCSHKMQTHGAKWCRIVVTLVIACCCYQEEVAVRSHWSTADFCTLIQHLSSNTSRVYWHICRTFLYLIYHLSVCCDVSKRGFVSRSLHYWWTLSGRPSYHHHFHLPWSTWSTILTVSNRWSTCENPEIHISPLCLAILLILPTILFILPPSSLSPLPSY